MRGGVTSFTILAGDGALDQISAADSNALAVLAVGRAPPPCAIDGSISLIWLTTFRRLPRAEDDSGLAFSPVPNANCEQDMFGVVTLPVHAARNVRRRSDGAA